MSATSAIDAQYSRGDLRARITDALRAAGKDPDRLSINDLGQIDEFHLRGRAATTGLADLAAIQGSLLSFFHRFERRRILCHQDVTRGRFRGSSGRRGRRG